MVCIKILTLAQSPLTTSPWLSSGCNVKEESLPSHQALPPLWALCAKTTGDESDKQYIIADSVSNKEDHFLKRSDLAVIVRALFILPTNIFDCGSEMSHRVGWKRY